MLSSLVIVVRHSAIKIFDTTSVREKLRGLLVEGWMLLPNSLGLAKYSVRVSTDVRVSMCVCMCCALNVY